MAKIIDGREISKQIRLEVKEKVEELYSRTGQRPKLVSFMVGHSEDSAIYVNMQKKAAEFVGIKFDICEADPDVSQEDLYGRIEELNADKTVTAIIIEKPLPENINHDKVVASMHPEKDAEGIHPYNLGKILRREADIVPCTPGAVMKILRVQGVNLYGKEVVIVGHSAIVGKPLSLMMLNELATTTVCHIGTHREGNLSGHVKKADVLVVAVGKAEMIKGDWIKPGAVVIDVGINRVGEKIVGDVDFAEACEKVSAITPVPGGVGPVTVSILMRNVLRAFRRQNVTV